jgi:ATP-dependent exoDNAse (exonuclease V) beta subunit
MELPELELPAPLDAPPFADLTVDAAGMSAKDLAAARSDVLGRARTRTYTSATAIKQAARAAAEEDEKQERQDETEPWARGRGSTRLGRAVHAAIQSLALDADAASIAAHARAQSVAEAIPDRQADVERLVTSALASEAAGRARETRALREVPFAVQRDGAVVEGFIDMLIDGPDGLEIVDWKTDRISAGQVPERLREYELQAGLYVAGIEAATSRQVTRITYVFVHAGIEASPGDARALAEAATAELQRVAS